MKECCKLAIANYKRSKALSELQKVAKFDVEIDGEGRKLLIAFLEGMKRI